MEDVKVYMVVNLEIEDKETYLKYEKGFFPILKKHGGEFITFDDSFKHMEGPEPLSGGRMIIFSFPSEAAAEAWYDDPEYHVVMSMSAVHGLQDLCHHPAFPATYVVHPHYRGGHSSPTQSRYVDTVIGQPAHKN